MNEHVTLAIYPHAMGFGYVCVEDGALLDYANVRPRPVLNKRLLGRIRKLIEFMRPQLIVLRDPHGKPTKRSQRLVEDLEKEFANSGRTIAKYTREEIKFVFAQFNARSKHEIALKLAEQFEELKERVPEPRKPWKREHDNMAIFNALSLVITHLYHTK